MQRGVQFFTFVPDTGFTYSTQCLYFLCTAHCGRVCQAWHVVSGVEVSPVPDIRRAEG